MTTTTHEAINFCGGTIHDNTCNRCGFKSNDSAAHLNEGGTCLIPTTGPTAAQRRNGTTQAERDARAQRRYEAAKKAAATRKRKREAATRAEFLRTRDEILCGTTPGNTRAVLRALAAAEQTPRHCASCPNAIDPSEGRFCVPCQNGEELSRVWFD